MYHYKYKKYKNKFNRLKQANTYLILPVFLNKDMLVNLIESRGNWRPYNEEIDGNHATFVYAEGNNFGSSKYSEIKATIKNTIGKSKNQIFYKNHLLMT